MNVGTTYNKVVQGTEYKSANGSKKTGKSAGIDAVKTTSSVGEANDISKANEGRLSRKAQDFLNNLRKQYGDYDFFIGNSTDDLKALSKSGSKEFSVIFSSSEIERMANDEKYAKEKMQGVEGAISMSKKICEQEGFVSAFGAMNADNGTVNKISISVDDNGNIKLFAELEKSSEKKRERLERTKEKRAEEKNAHDKAGKKNPYEKDEKDLVKRTTVEAASIEELIEKIRNIDWSSISDSKSGDRFNFSV